MAKPELKPITFDAIANLQIDDKHNLYWNGRRLRTQISLTWFQTVAALIAIVASFATIGTGLNNTATIVCSRGRDFPLIGCPVQPMAAPPVSPTKAP